MLTAKLSLYSKNVITCKIYLDNEIISCTYGHMVTYIPHEDRMHTLTIEHDPGHTDYHVDKVEAEFEWRKEFSIGGLNFYSYDAQE